MVIIGLGLAWLGGILTGHWVRLPLVFVAGALVPLAVFLILRRHGRLLITLALGIVAFVAADAHASASLYEFDEQDLRYYNDRGTFEIEGMVAGDADIRDRNTRLTVEVSAIRLDDGWHDVGGKLLVLVPRYPDRHYGDVLRLSGELRTPPHLDDFDYRGYLEHHGIYSIMYYPRVEVLGTGDGLAFLRWVYAVRERLSRVLARVLPEPQASLAQGILLGIRSNIPGWLNEAFSRSGTFHLLAISGLNISIMAGIMLGAGILLFGRRHYVYVWLALAAIWVYALLTGMSPPVVRSAIMAGLFLLAEALGRQRSAVVVILLAGAIMAGISPYILGDVSFQLSFLAMLGLIFIYPVLRSFRERLVPEGGGIWHLLSGAVIDTIGASLAAIIAVLPLIVRYFGIFSPVAPLATLLTVPVLPLTISVGVVTACGGAIWLPLGQ
ncbi:MAG: ComEC family competence protein, partial [Dehalococcoidales bacterium]|nr:ComEC family competence protein [Dehalococcoidales bacterium]